MNLIKDMFDDAEKRFGKNPTKISPKELIEFTNDVLEKQGYRRTFNMKQLVDIFGDSGFTDKDGNLDERAMKFFFPGYRVN